MKKNLRESFPEKTDEERLQIEKRFYHFFCDYIFETIKLASMSKAKIKRHMKFQGLEHINQAISEGKNVALYLAHYCNWEWVTSVTLHLPEGVYPGQIYHILESKVFDSLMLKLRSRFGSVNIERHLMLRKVVEVYKEDKQMVIGFIADHAPEIHTIRHWTNFLNHDTAVITGTETVVKKYNFACLYLDIVCERRGYYTVKIVPLAMDPSKYGDFEITDMYVNALEQTIRRQPEYWLWTHNRWKRTRKYYEEFLRIYPNHQKE